MILLYIFGKCFCTVKVNIQISFVESICIESLDLCVQHSIVTINIWRKYYVYICIKLSCVFSAGARLHRGYCMEAMMDDKPTDITHLVFVVHGIGQKMDTGHIVRCCLE
jgi:hypothetical protein